MIGRRGRQRAERDVFGWERVPLVSPAEAAAMDSTAHDAFGVPGRVLMESAGRCAAQVLDRLFPRGRVLVVAGSGNNGGDALVLARVLRAWGRDTAITAVGSNPPDRALLHGFDLVIQQVDSLAANAAGADVIVDGILGTGARGEPREPAATAIRSIGESGRAVLALDLPSGVDAETGGVASTAIRAEATVTFGWPKTGLMFHPARQHCGRLIAVEIGFPPIEAGNGTPTLRASLITPAWASARLPARPPDGHKGTSGRLLVLAGSKGMAGAAVLSARSAQRAGAGLVRIASVEANRAVIHESVPEATFVERSTLDSGAGSVHALLAGPGIGTDETARAALAAALERTGDCPAVLDADALNLLATDQGGLEKVAGGRPLAITPHVMELARLTGTRVDTITADPAKAARDAAARFGCTVLLKGQPSIVAAPDGTLLVNTTGSSDVATAGMGDQLAGAIGAMLAAGLDPVEAAAVGLFYSGRAADLSGLGRSLSPVDVCEALPAAFSRPGARWSPLRLPFVTFDQPPRW